MSASSTSRKTAKNSHPKKRAKRVPFDLDNPDHNALIVGGLSENKKTPKKSEKIKVDIHQAKRSGKRKKSSSKHSSDQTKIKKLQSALAQFQGHDILFGDDDIDPSELDEHGNIKDLIDYSNPEDYAIYDQEMKRREKLENKMSKRPHIVFSETGGDEEKDDEKDDEKSKSNTSRKRKAVDSSEEDSEESEIDDESETESSDENDQENMKQAMGLISYLLEQQTAGNSLSDFQARVAASNIPESCKQIVHKRLANTDPDKPKLIEWVESLLSIPFGLFAVSPVTISDPLPKIRGFFDETIKQFNKNVYGLENVKQQIIDYLGQFIAAGSNASPRTLALCGGPGIGKTFLIRHGIADALGRPLRVVNMGGIKDSAHMCGFEYSYANARYGTVVQILIEKQVMNPIILFEEVDKISETRDGQDIQNILMHMTDPEQNKAFQDKYFAGIDIDISKAILVFTLNDPSALSPILLNRLHLVHVPDPTREDKIQIAKHHMILESLKNVNMHPDLVKISDEIYGYILDRYCQGDKGLRTFKRCLETVMLRLNMIRLIGKDLSGKLQLTFPVILNTEIVDTILREPNHSSLSSSSFMYL